MDIVNGIGWVEHPRKGPGYVRSATPGEYAAEIERLRGDRHQIEAALDRRGLFLFAHVDGTYTIQEK